jgi:hypothetical protein
LSKVDFDKENNVKDADKVKESIKSEWADFITTTSSKGADTTTPPANTGGAKTKDEILAIKDPSERQAAIAENHELFGI